MTSATNNSFFFFLNLSRGGSKYSLKNNERNFPSLPFHLHPPLVSGFFPKDFMLLCLTGGGEMVLVCNVVF